MEPNQPKHDEMTTDESSEEAARTSDQTDGGDAPNNNNQGHILPTSGVRSGLGSTSGQSTVVGLGQEHPRESRTGSGVDIAGPDATASDEEIRELEGRWYQLDFAVGRSLRYHAKRRAFFEHCNHWTRAISAIAGFGTVAMVIQGFHWATITAGTIVGIATALDLVFDYSKRTMAYDDLYRRFADLGIKISDTSHTAENYRQLVTERRKIEKEEPTVMIVLDAVCHNEERKSRGFDDTYKINPMQKMLCQCFDFDGDKISLHSAG